MKNKFTGRFDFMTARTIIDRVIADGFLIFVLVTCPVFGQGNCKRLPTVDDYKLWGTVHMGKVSEQGSWISFYMDYEDQPDTLFVKSIDGKREYKFADVDAGTFYKEKWFAFMGQDQSLHLLGLETGIESLVANVDTYCFSWDFKYLVTFEKTGSSAGVAIRNGKGKIVKRIDGVYRFKSDGIGRAFVCATRKNGSDQVVLVSVDTFDEVVLSESISGSFGQLVWQKNGGSLAFLGYGDKTSKFTERLAYYNLKDRILRKFDPAANSNIPDDKMIGTESVSQLMVSDDGLKVFFGLVDRQPSRAFSNDTVQIWNGNDRRIFPQRSMTLNHTIMPKLSVWKPFENRFFQLATDERPMVFLDGKQRYAVSYHPSGTGTDFQIEPLVDLYITDLRSGKTVLWLEKQSQRLDEMSISPYGKFAAYLQDGHWQLYNFETGKHDIITNASMGQFISSLEFGGDGAYGIAGWARNGKSVLFYDQYDIWSYSFKTKKVKRLTNGRSSRCEYRVSSFCDLSVQNFDGLTDNGIDTEKELTLKGTNIFESGYYRLAPDGRITEIIRGKFRVRDLNTAADCSNLAFITERYDRPPDIQISSQKGGSLVRLFQSNEFYEKFDWGRNEVVGYANSKGELLSGILFFPAGYDASKKYPLIVHIYEEQLYQLHAYRNPTTNSEVGFSIDHYLLNGYLVFLPDITYRLGDPGVSAADCVVAGTKKVLEMGVVDPGKVGLIGHSFGGYESYFIITQTDIFAAAVAGAGVSDMRSFYFSAGLLGVPDFFRSENQQWRMGKSIFEDLEAYERNSPVKFAANVTTPLLHWAGEKDAVIDSYQAVGFYLALRRLNKTQQFLLYPHEAHWLMKSSFQIDLSQRVFEWFEYYLKGRPPAPWILKGTS